MDTIKLIINPETLSRSQHNSIVGTVYFAMGNADFPAKNWSDFVVVVLGWWLEATSPYISKARLQFMDGPYFLAISSQWHSLVKVQCFDESVSRNQETCSVMVLHSEFRREIESAARIVSKVCRAKGWSSQDIDRLNYLLGEV